MKKWSKTIIEILIDILLVIILIISASLFAGIPPDSLSQQVEKLTKTLQLTAAQVPKVKEILKKAQEQAVKDREAFKTDAATLVELAWERREITNMEIEALLNPEQKQEFKRIIKMAPFDRELFDLTEGLLLNDDQVFAVEGILIDYYNTLKDMIPEEVGERMEEGDEELAKRRRRPTGLGMGMARYGMFKTVMEELKEKKEKAIKKVLTDEQKDLYQQFRRYRAERMKEWMKRRMEQ